MHSFACFCQIEQLPLYAHLVQNVSAKLPNLSLLFYFAFTESHKKVPDFAHFCEFEPLLNSQTQLLHNFILSHNFIHGYHNILLCQLFHSQWVTIKTHAFSVDNVGNLVGNSIFASFLVKK